MRGRRVRRGIAIFLVALLLGMAAWLEQKGFAELLRDKERLGRLIVDLGPWGPVAIVLIEVLQVLLAPIPGHLVGIAAGYLYGVFRGTLLCSLGLGIGSGLAAWLARQLGRPLVERLVGPELLGRIDAYARRRGPLIFFLIFLIPFLPDDLVCFIAGLSPLRISALVLFAVVGRLPGVIAASWIGAYARRLSWRELLPLGCAGLLLAVLFWRYQKPLERAMFRLLKRLGFQE
ncbi:MAG: TVP38/TMEM64 family protein [Anaerolineae bacterium]|nr:TVP38/TMEM64 family protein [Anaerolineae bacterium]